MRAIWFGLSLMLITGPSFSSVVTEEVLEGTPSGDYFIELQCKNYYRKGIFSDTYRGSQINIVYHGKGSFDEMIFTSIDREECISYSRALDQAIQQIDTPAYPGELKAVCKSAGDHFILLNLVKGKAKVRAAVFRSSSGSDNCSDVESRLNAFFQGVRAREKNR